MEELRPRFSSGTTDLVGHLPLMFDEIRGLAFGAVSAAQPERYLTEADVSALGRLVEDLRSPLELVELSGTLGSPWAAVSLRRDEVRNGSVLRWFLDPKGRHGCGDALLTFLLEKIGSKLERFPTAPSKHCAISVEENPDGDRVSRVDLQIDDAAFFVLIEIKIAAPEQPRQVERYCDIAATRAGVRPWAVVFLTIDGRAPITAGKYTGKVVSVSWGEVASALRKATRDAQPIPRFLARTFAAHINDL